ncbi:uncharacterized protein LOC109946659 [Prunus persica]|uniref:uncharacterized protein LOC109946659 n=1 Tax=Prunus persica TaxID=3760 RepID=UPI0009AB283F|nr:uncharacterized protein LOC109946659 [Prunus persica]
MVEPRDNQTVPIKVRGKNVDLSPSIISDVLNLPGEDTGEWNRYLGRDFNLQDAAERLFYADPTAFASQTKKTVLTQGKLTPYFAILWSFVRHNIYPSGQRSEIPIIGVKILKILHEGTFPLPVGDIIFERLKDCARKKHIIYYPCLVSMICTDSGVRVRSNDIIAKPMGLRVFLSGAMLPDQLQCCTLCLHRSRIRRHHPCHSHLFPVSTLPHGTPVSEPFGTCK